MGRHRQVRGAYPARPGGRAPYFHNNSAVSLNDVVTFYNSRLNSASKRARGLDPLFRTWVGDAVTAYWLAGRMDDVRRLVRSLESRPGQYPCRWPKAVAATARAYLSEHAGGSITGRRPSPKRSL
jgi:hypothetical protein